MWWLRSMTKAEGRNVWEVKSMCELMHCTRERRIEISSPESLSRDYTRRCECVCVLQSEERLLYTCVLSTGGKPEESTTRGGQRRPKTCHYERRRRES